MYVPNVYWKMVAHQNVTLVYDRYLTGDYSYEISCNLDNHYSLSIICNQNQ